MISIDQNSHSLWDTLPKLQALTSAGREVCHYLEDIDVACTALGADIDSPNLRIEQERFHASGGQDWGAAAFYNDFLGRLPVEIRQWEAPLGMKIAALARQLDQPLEDLYKRYATSDNWMLIGSSYIHDREHHRLIGDLSVEEVAPFVRQILTRAKDDCLARFPQDDSQARTREWFAAETQRVDTLLEGLVGRTLPDLYRAWLGEYLDPTVRQDMTSQLFSFGADAPPDAMVELFLRDYDTTAGLYNQAVTETNVGVHPLDTEAGELPFFAFLRYQGRRVRCELRFVDGTLHMAGREFAVSNGNLPVDALRSAGVEGVAGKALVLAIQARLRPNGGTLALPHWGSMYMPASHRFAALLAERGWLPGALAPVVRVRFRFLDRLRSLETTIRLPRHLVRVWDRREIPARQLGEHWADLANEAKQRLADFADAAKRSAWQNTNLPRQTQTLAKLNRKKRQIAAENPKDPRIRALWKRIKAMQNLILTHTLDRIALDWQLTQLEFYDSRGALLPWCVALGGKAFYEDLIQNAEITEETQ